MNQIVLRGKPAKRLLFAAASTTAVAILLFPAFVQIDCDTGNILKCWVYRIAGPYIGAFLAIVVLGPARRFLLGNPIVILTRDGIETGGHPIGTIPWAHIDDVKIEHVHLAERLVVRRKADTVPPKPFLERMLSAFYGLNARTRLYVLPMHIDRPLHHLKHWIDEGRRNAAAGLSPDPFFTVPG